MNLPPGTLPLGYPACPEYPGGVWVDPVFKLAVPKDHERNLKLRAWIVDHAKENPAYREAIMGACARSLILWLNLFGWTFRQRETIEDGRSVEVRSGMERQVFITWPAQDKFLKDIESAAAAGVDIVADKSREQGASWLCCAYLFHRWLFEPDFTALAMARVEDDVDKKGNPKSLFWKLDFLYECLPDWMAPPVERQSMHLRNIHRRGVIDGVSTNRHASRGDRRKVILLDEAAAMENLESILSATHSVAPFRIFNSTPVGYNTFAKLRFSGKVRVSVLHWSNHPEQGRGREAVTDPASGEVKWTSPFYRFEQAHRSAKEIAQNLDIDYMASGTLFFDAPVIARLRAAARPPVTVGDLLSTCGTGAERDMALRQRKVAVRWVPNFGSRPWRLWFDPADYGGRYRPDHTIVMGADIGWGQGASNSTICVIDRELRAVIAEYADANTDPAEFARVLAAAGLWFGGPRGCAFIVWEANGGGGTTGLHLVRRLRYPWYYLRDEGMDSQHVFPKPTDAIGWHSTDTSKVTMLGELRAALARGEVDDPSDLAIDELGTYVFYESGSVGPASLEEESATARKTHGDRVIGRGLGVLGMKRAPAVPLVKPTAEPGSIIWRREQDKRQQAAQSVPKW